MAWNDAVNTRDSRDEPENDENVGTFTGKDTVLVSPGARVTDPELCMRPPGTASLITPVTGASAMLETVTAAL